MGCIDYHPDMHGIVEPPHIPLVGQCVPLHLFYCTCCLFRVSFKKKKKHARTDEVFSQHKKIYFLEYEQLFRKVSIRRL